MTSQDAPPLVFQVFNEIGIIEQLSRTVLEAHMPKGLIAPHFGVLNHLVRVGDGSTPMAMARAFQVPKTSMTHTVAGLVKHGLVEMRPNPEDGLSKQVWLTEAGRTLRARIIIDMSPQFERLARDFDISKLQDILPVLTELRIYFDENRNRV
ncbi:MarR family winged helix-turn-helix transcriptional regulator [Ruegeria jejuensis]|uniref:MarR family winged helix-turn-helix transcriptional regulator n=1 Tax=Ruegeria jejuensis TaxID=3233338 RepID=UPI00355BE663